MCVLKRIFDYLLWVIDWMIAVGDYLYAVMLGLWALAVTVPFAAGMIWFSYLLIFGAGE